MMSAKGDRDNEFIILLIGDSGVGKTSLVKRFRYTKAIELHGKTVKFQIWVAEGQGRVLSLTRSFFRHINGIIVVYDVSNQESFENVKNWFRKVESNASEHVSKLLVGNKNDLTTRKVVDYNTAKDFADKLGIAFLETSAKDGTNVKQVFTTMASDIYSRVSPPISNEHTQDGSGSINLGVSVKPYGFGRCY